ncbi:MAG: hypothetical protein ACRDNG_01335 [Gaiellaceae bacterium]
MDGATIEGDAPEITNELPAAARGELRQGGFHARLDRVVEFAACVGMHEPQRAGVRLA